jgi:hypothetical protein
MHRAFSQYRAYAGPLDRIRKGALVSMAGAALRRHHHTWQQPYRVIGGSAAN